MATCEAVWKEDSQVYGRLHQRSNPPILRQHENYSPGSEPSFHTQTKHIEVHYHFIRECVMARDVDLRHISMSLQTTDIFTKAMGADKLRQFMKNLGLLIVDQPSLGGSEAPILDEQS